MESSMKQSDLITGDILDEFCNKLRHLYRSQNELMSYLLENPGDVLIKETIDENIVNIRVLCRKIEFEQWYGFLF